PLPYRTRAGEPSARAERSRSEPEPLRAMTKQTIRRALLYTRVSTQDQADHGYSLRDQEARLRAWCAREGVEVAGHYQDDHSAKTFERPQWTKLLARLESGRVPDADTVLVVKWDRFSRDATGALGMIRRLEGLGVGVQAVEQPIDRSVPEQLMMLAIYVAAPEVDNRRRSLAVKAGMRRAMQEGRWMRQPPKGYLRSRDDQERYLIVPGPDADFVREAFRLAADTDLPINVIARRLRKAGFKCVNSRLHTLLRDPVYAGRIVVPAWKGEPEEEVQGVHEPLIDEATFARVQEKRFKVKGATAGRRRKIVAELPLKGHLLEPETLGVLTGSGSRSRHGYRVWYYHGQGKGAYRVRADKAHEAFEAMLAEVRLAPEVAELLRAMAAERGADGERERKRRRRDAEARPEEAEGRLVTSDTRSPAGAAERGADGGRERKRRRRDAQARLEKAEERRRTIDTRYLDGELDRESHARLLAHYRGERDQARVAPAEAEGAATSEPAHVRYAAAVLERLPDVWRGASPEARDGLVGSIW